MTMWPIIFALSLLFGGRAGAEPMSFELRASASTVLLGAPVELAGTARYPERFQLSIKKENQETEPFTIQDVQLDPPKTEGGMKTQPVRLQVFPFDLGSQTFPALEWTLADASGATQTLQSPPVKLDVTGPDTRSSDLHDIRGPFRPPMWMLVALLLVVAATLALAGYETWSFFNSKRASQTGGPAVRKPAHEEALEALEGLQDSGLGIRPIYDRLAEILRVYLERRFEIPALVLTTSDLLRMMRQAEIDRPVVGLAKDLFARADLVKFAKLIPEAPEIRQDIAAAIEIVKATAPKPPPVPEPSLHQVN